LITVGAASTAISIAGEYSHGRNTIHQWLLGNVTVLGATLNLLLISLVLFPGRIQDLNEDIENPTIRLAARCINGCCLRAWTWFWVFLGLVYVTLLFSNTVGAYEHLPVRFGEEGPAATISASLLDLFSTGSTFFLALVYLFLSPSFLRDFATTHRHDYRHFGATPIHWWEWREFWVATVWIAPVGLLVVVYRVCLLHLWDPYGWDRTLSGIVGVTSAVALAHFVGRMDSKFILNWQWAIPVLFLYAGIQVYSSVLYESAPINRAAFVYGAFTMKCVLFVFVSNFFERLRVLYYAVELIEGEGGRV
jgi:hypothetical protein